MATMIYCDYCGELIEGPRAGISSGSFLERSPYSQDGVSERSFSYHSRAAGLGDSCFAMAARTLEDMAAWAHRGEGTDMHWMLVRRSTADNSKLRPGTDEYRDVYYCSDLHEIGIDYSKVHALIKAGYPNLEQLVFCDEETLGAISGVGAKTVAQIKVALEQRGMALGQMENELAEGGRA